MREVTLVIAVIFIAIAILGSVLAMFVNCLWRTIKAKRIYELLAREYGEHEAVLLEWLCFGDYGHSDSRFQQTFFCRHSDGLLSPNKSQIAFAASAETSLEPYCKLSEELIITLLEGHCHFLPVNPKIGGRKAWLQASLETMELDTLGGSLQTLPVIRILAMTNTDEDVLKKLGLI